MIYFRRWKYIYIRFNPIYQNILKYHVRKECYGKIFLKNLFDIN